MILLPNGPLGLAPLKDVLSIFWSKIGTQLPKTAYALESAFCSSLRVLILGSIMKRLKILRWPSLS